MIKEIYVIKDNAVDAFNTPIYFNSEKEMVGTFTRQLRNEESYEFKNKQDFHVYYLGTFDTETGKLDSIPAEFKFSLDSLAES